MPNSSPKIDLRLPADMLDTIRERAAAKGDTPSGYIRLVLARHLRQPTPDMPEGRKPAAKTTPEKKSKKM